MRRLDFFLVSALVVAAAALQFVHGQFEARNTVPDTITGCYINTTAYNRFARLPMHIDNLIAIIRKIETKTNGQWTARRIARTLVHRYMFDGMEFKTTAKPELAFRQKPEELAKSLLVKELIPIPPEEIFPDILDNDERCALHWMLSHSMNATMRDEELNPGFGTNPNTGYGYSSGNNPIGGNNGFNNNNGNNGYPNSGSSANNQWGNRGKREVANEGSDSNWNLSNETSSKKKDSQEQDNKDYDGTGKSSEEQDDYGEVHVISNVSLTSSSKSARQMSAQQNEKKRTRRPIETGVVYTKWGSVAAGRVIAGIAAGLEPTTMSVTGGAVYKQEASYGGTNPWSGGSGLGNGNSWGSGAGKTGDQYPGGQGLQPQYPGQQPPQYPNQQQPPPYAPQYAGRKKRQVPTQNLTPLESLYAATLAGDAGQAAILNAQNEMQNAMLPAGIFNDSVCPREYILKEHIDPTKEIYKSIHAWTYLTEAEIRGGVDGIILGSNIRRWDPSYTLRLSDILSQYYSESGIAGETQFKSCERSSLLSSSLQATNMREQTKSFAYVYNNRTSEISSEMILQNPNLFERIVNEANERMQQTASSLSQIDGPCTRRQGSGGSDNDDQKYTIPRLTVYGVLDHSATIPEIEEQKRFLGQLAYELEVNPGGSRLGVIDGNSGTVLISPNWTDVSSVLACRTMGLYAQMKTQDYSRVMTSLRSELERVKNEELRHNYTNQNGVIILFMVQGKRLEDYQRNDIIRIGNEITRDVTDVTVVATSTKYQEAEFDGIRYIKVQQGAQNFSNVAYEFSQSLIKNAHGSLEYPQCNAFQFSQENEHKEHRTWWLDPNTIQYFKISPNNFFSSRSLILRFTSEFGKVRVCASRKEWYPNKNNEGNNNVHCRETSGNYVVPGQNTADAEFRDGIFHQPCGKNGKKEGCDPIYISVTPTTFPKQGEIGADCSLQGCQASNQVKITFTHWDMRCNGAMRTILSSTIAIITASIALLNWMKTT